MDKKVFRTREEARYEAKKMRGWTAPHACPWAIIDEHGVERSGWVIECHAPGASRRSAPLYLREDGYVR
jgi:hypothetical protein